MSDPTPRPTPTTLPARLPPTADRTNALDRTDANAERDEPTGSTRAGAARSWTIPTAPPPV